MQLSVHRVIWARGIDPGITVFGEDGRPFYVDETRRTLGGDGAVAVKLFGHYENAPSRRTSIDATPEAPFSIAPSADQLQAIWVRLIEAIASAINDWDDDDGEVPWHVFGGVNGDRGIEISAGGSKFMVRLVGADAEQNDSHDDD